MDDLNAKPVHGDQAAAIVPADVPVIDWNVIEELKAVMQDDSSEFVQEMFDLYARETPPLIESVQKAVSENSAYDLRLYAHSLKGSSNSLGALRVGKLGAHLEGIGKAKTTEGAAQLLPDLDKEFQSFLQAFRQAGFK